LYAKKHFHSFQSYEEIIFPTNSQLRRIEDYAFASLQLTPIDIPQSVEILCAKCVDSCESLEEPTFEANSQGYRIRNRHWHRQNCHALIGENPLKLFVSNASVHATHFNNLISNQFTTASM
jgi:hypothetical protein